MENAKQEDQMGLQLGKDRLASGVAAVCLVMHNVVHVQVDLEVWKRVSIVVRMTNVVVVHVAVEGGRVRPFFVMDNVPLE